MLSCILVLLLLAFLLFYIRKASKFTHQSLTPQRSDSSWEELWIKPAVALAMPSWISFFLSGFFNASDSALNGKLQGAVAAIFLLSKADRVVKAFRQRVWKCFPSPLETLNLEHKKWYRTYLWHLPHSWGPCLWGLWVCGRNSTADVTHLHTHTRSDVPCVREASLTCRPCLEDWW